MTEREKYLNEFAQKNKFELKPGMDTTTCILCGVGDYPYCEINCPAEEWRKEELEQMDILFGPVDSK